MKKEAKKIYLHRCIWLILTIVAIIVFCCTLNAEYSDSWYLLQLNFSGYFLLLCIILFVDSFCLCYETYSVQGHEIIVYAGWYHHYVKVDEEVCDFYDSVTILHPITLCTEIDENTKIEATFSPWGSIKTKANGKLLPSKKQTSSIPFWENTKK